jgi:hypothetical protein
MKGYAIQIIDNTDQGNLMDIKVVPKYDTEGKIVSGLVIGDTLQQNKALILMSNPGEHKNAPTQGVGLADAGLSEGSNLIGFRHKIRSNFTQDGLVTKKLELYNLNNVEIEAEYQ